MKLIDWIKSRIYKNYVPLVEHNAMLLDRDIIISHETLANKAHRRTIEELEKKIYVMESERFVKPITTEPIKFTEVCAQTNISAIHLDMMHPSIRAQHIRGALISQIAEELGDYITVLDDYDGLRNTYRYQATVYIGTKGDN